MIEHLKAHGAAFNPDEVRVLTAAFDKAWLSIQASEAKLGGNGKAARTFIARHIIEAAKQGERDQDRLGDGALLAIGRI